MTQKVEIALHFDRTMHCEFTVFLPGLKGQEDRKSEKRCQPFILWQHRTLTLVSIPHTYSMNIFMFNKYFNKKNHKYDFTKIKYNWIKVK